MKAQFTSQNLCAEPVITKIAKYKGKQIRVIKMFYYSIYNINKN